jgi:hypothetical protein
MPTATRLRRETMTTMGILTALLKPEYIKLGWALSEDEDFLYVHKDGKIVATFSAYRATIEKVVEFINKYTEGN